MQAVLLSTLSYILLTNVVARCKKCVGKRTLKEKKKVDFVVERGSEPGEQVILRGEGDESVRSACDLH